jgi:nitrate/TMAO reductase-like tetraheme cytochrome c subunit
VIYRILQTATLRPGEDRIEIGRWIAVLAVFLFLALPATACARMDRNTYEFSLICESCHSDLYEEWSHSYHAMSWEDSLFQDMYAAVQASSDEIHCLSCHAPIAWNGGDRKVMEGISREGVNCDWCHTLHTVKGRGDIIEFRSREGNTKVGREGTGKSIYHEIQGEASFGSADFCASCHHYRNTYGVLIYSDYESWKSSSFAARDVTCQDCHMPESTSRASNFGAVRNDISSHRFHGWRSMEMLRKACAFSASLSVSRDSVRIRTTVTNRGAGHKFPGGTPLRELVVRFIGLDGFGEEVFENTRLRYGVELEVPGTDSLNLWEARSIVKDERLVFR